MEAYTRTEGVVSGKGQIQAKDLPFKEGEKVELLIRPVQKQRERKATRAEIAQRLKALHEYDEWNRKNIPADLPSLPDEAFDRGIIYEDRL